LLLPESRFFLVSDVAGQGLPDGIFSNQKTYIFGKIYYGLGMRKVSRFCGNLEYIMATWYILRAFGNLWQFGIFSPVLVYFVKKNLATLRWPQTQKDGRQKRLVRPSRTIFFEDVFLFAAVCLLSTLTGRVARCF
jgi:hypothetical protein